MGSENIWNLKKSLEIGKKLEVLTKFWDLWTNLKFKENGNLVKFWNLEKVLKFEKNGNLKKIWNFGRKCRSLGKNFEIENFLGNWEKVWKWGGKLE